MENRWMSAAVAAVSAHEVRWARDGYVSPRPGDTVVAGEAGHAQALPYATALAGREGYALAGEAGHAFVGAGGAADVERGGVAYAGLDGAASAGPGGTVCVEWWDVTSCRLRVAVGYVPHEGAPREAGQLEPGVRYRATRDGALVPVEGEGE